MKKEKIFDFNCYHYISYFLFNISFFVYKKPL